MSRGAEVSGFQRLLETHPFLPSVRARLGERPLVSETCGNQKPVTASSLGLPLVEARFELEANAPEAFGPERLDLLVLEAALSHAAVELPPGDQRLASPRPVILPCVEEGDRLFDLVFVPVINVAVLAEPLAENVLLIEILAGGLSDRGRAGEPVCVPVNGSFDPPSEDARPLGD